MRPLSFLLFTVFPVLAAPLPEEILPTAKSPFVQGAEAQRAELHKAIRAYMALEPGKFGAHPAAADFPGAVESKERVSTTVSYNANLRYRWDTTLGNAPDRATGPDVWQETGLYAAPGEVVTVRADKLPADRTVEIIVGCHRDSLLKLEKWQRFPIITRSFELKPGENRIANAFGGQLFIQIKAKGGPLPVVTDVSSLVFSNAVAAPTYVLGRDTQTTWEKSRLAAAPWGTLVGKCAILHLASSELRKLETPEALLAWWDKALAMEDDLVALARLAPERIVPDRQISAGFMHSGYPFMCIQGASQKDITDLTKLTTQGNWGFFHELGHNHQRHEWTFEGQVEVTCNLFSLYLMENLVGKPRGQGHPSMVNLDAVLGKRLANPPDLGPFEQLATFVVLTKAHGWEPLRATLRSYASEPVPNTVKDPAALQSLFVGRYGHAAKADVSAYFTRIGYQVSAATREALKAYPPFEPALPPIGK